MFKGGKNQDAFEKQHEDVRWERRTLGAKTEKVSWVQMVEVFEYFAKKLNFIPGLKKPIKVL